MSNRSSQPGLRYPLLIGLRAFRLIALVPAWTMVAIALSQILHFSAPDLPFGLPLRMLGFTGLVLALGVAILPWVLIPTLVFGASRFKKAIQARACDLLLEKDGILIEGGPAHGFRSTWAILGGPDGTRRTNDGLWLRGENGRSLSIPFTVDPDEKASVEALGATIAARAATRRTEEPRRSPPGTIECKGCGATQPPAGVSEINCQYCNTKIQIPEELAQKTRAMQVVALKKSKEDRFATALTRQKSARLANLIAFLGGTLVAVLATVSVLAGAVVLFIDGKEAGLPRANGLGFSELGLCLVLLSVVRWQLSDRRALRLLTLGFSAIAPSRPEDALQCRSCCGPLPDPEEGSAVARCVYCGASSIMAADLRAEQSIIRRFGEVGESPEKVLEKCSKQRSRSKVMAVLGAGITIYGLISLYWTPKVNGAHAATIPFEQRQFKSAKGVVLAGPGAKRVERVASLGVTDSVRLFAASGGGVDALLSGQTTRLAKNISAEPVRLEVLTEVPKVSWPWARLTDGAMAFGSTEGIRIRTSAGQVSTIYASGFYRDPILMDLASGPGESVLATTRASDEGHLRIRQIERDGSSKVVMEDAKEAAFSPTGDRMAVAHLVGERFQIWVATGPKWDSGEQLTQGKGHAAVPTWSPDGRRIAFLSRSVRDPIQYATRYGDTQLWTIDFEGRATQLTVGDPLEMSRPVWTSEGIFVLSRQMGKKDYETVVWKVVPAER